MPSTAYQVGGSGGDSPSSYVALPDDSATITLAQGQRRILPVLSGDEICTLSLAGATDARSITLWRTDASGNVYTVRNAGPDAGDFELAPGMRAVFQFDEASQNWGLADLEEVT